MNITAIIVPEELDLVAAKCAINCIPITCIDVVRQNNLNYLYSYKFEETIYPSHFCYRSFFNNETYIFYNNVCYHFRYNKELFKNLLDFFEKYYRIYYNSENLISFMLNNYEDYFNKKIIRSIL